MITYEDALYQISEYESATRKKLNTTTRQRRNAIYNSFGQERSVDVLPNKDGMIYMPITTDLSSFIRWNFKLVIRPISGTTVPNITKFNLIFDGFDCTDLFVSQHTLPTGEGIFPNKSMGDFYDIIKVCEMLSDIDRDKMLNGGLHTLQIQCDQSVNVTLLEFVSYSFIARHGKSANDYNRMDHDGAVDVPGNIGGGGDGPRKPTLATFGDKADLLLERSQLIRGLATVQGSRANQFIESAVSATRINEIDRELAKIDKMEDLQNG